MQTITDYFTIVQDSSWELDVQIAKGIAQGWQPLGGVSTALKNDSCLVFSQAMVKYAPTTNPIQGALNEAND